MQAFYVNATLRAMVFSMVGIFTPVYIYQLYYPAYPMKVALFAVGTYFLVVRLVTAVSAIPVSRVIEKIGFRRSIFLSVFMLWGGFLGLYFAGRGTEFLILGAVLTGVNIAFYWISRYSAVTMDSGKARLGKQIGAFAVAERVSSMLGPVAGGYVIAAWGFRVLYFVAIFVLIVSVVPLFSMPHHVHRNGVSLRGFWRWVKSREFFHQAVATVGRVLDDYGNSFFWPLTIYLMGVGAAVMGGVFSLVAVVPIVVKYASGVFFDRLRRRRDYADEAVFGVAAVLNAALWVVRMFLTGIYQIIWVDGILGLAGTVYRSWSDDYFYLGGKRMSEIAYWTYKELLFSMVAVGMVLVFWIGVYFDVWKELLFITTSLWVVLGAVQARESNLR